MQVSFTLDDREVQEALTRAARAVGNLGGLMRTLANQQFRSTVRNFQRESFDGRKWPRLAESTANRRLNPVGAAGPRKAWTQIKIRKGHGPAIRLKGPGAVRGGANILHPTGRHLLQTIHQSHTDEEARVFTANPWAFVHNFGAPMKRGWQMPRRTFLGFSQEDYSDIAARCQEYLDKSVLP